jgi:hypothetical protein
MSACANLSFVINREPKVTAMNIRPVKAAAEDPQR